MAYEGGVEFDNQQFGDLNLFSDLTLSDRFLDTVIWEFIDPNMKVDAGIDIVDSNGTKRGVISPDSDEEARNSMVPSMVVLTRPRRGPGQPEKGEGEHCVLYVRQVKSEVCYERVGVGRIEESCGLKRVERCLVG
jgi:hypothetical protein